MDSSDRETFVSMNPMPAPTELQQMSFLPPAQSLLPSLDAVDEAIERLKYDAQSLRALRRLVLKDEGRRGIVRPAPEPAAVQPGLLPESETDDDPEAGQPTEYLEPPGAQDGAPVPAALPEPEVGKRGKRNMMTRPSVQV